MIFELAHWLGILPLLWLGTLAFGLQPRGQEWWWLASGFAVSFLADSLAHVLPAEVPSNAYPFLQAIIVSIVLLDRWDTISVYAVLIGAGLIALLLDGGTSFDLMLLTVAYGAIALVAYQHGRLKHQSPLLRLSLLVTFGGGLLAWWGYCMEPGWAGWLAFQGARLVGTGLFMAAALQPARKMQLA